MTKNNQYADDVLELVGQGYMRSQVAYELGLKRHIVDSILNKYKFKKTTTAHEICQSVYERMKSND